jgi:uncharacterized protein DUF4180
VSERVEIRHGERLVCCADDGPVIRTEQDAVDLIALSFEHEAGTVVVPVARLDPDFFVLRTRVAGEIAQKFANYRRRLVIVGGIAPWLEESGPLRDFVTETNRGDQLWILADLDELDQRLLAGTRR